MQINTQQEVSKGRVGISPNLIKNSVRVDINGNEIDPKTKEIIEEDNTEQDESILRK